MHRTHWSKQTIASVSALALLTASLTPWPVSRAALAAEAMPPVATGAAKPATKPPVAATNPQGEGGDKQEGGIVNGVRKQAASVGMLLLLLAAAPGNLARNVDQAIQKADFGKPKNAEEKTSARPTTSGALPGPR
jgi:hypothetical protein